MLRIYRVNSLHISLVQCSYELTEGEKNTKWCISELTWRLLQSSNVVSVFKPLLQKINLLTFENSVLVVVYYNCREIVLLKPVFSF